MPVVVGALVLAALLGGCGGSSDGGTSAERTAVSEWMEAARAAAEPGKVTIATLPPAPAAAQLKRASKQGYDFGQGVKSTISSLSVGSGISETEGHDNFCEFFLVFLGDGDERFGDWYEANVRKDQAPSATRREIVHELLEITAGNGEELNPAAFETATATICSR